MKQICYLDLLKKGHSVLVWLWYASVIYITYVMVEARLAHVMLKEVGYTKF